MPSRCLKGLCGARTRTRTGTTLRFADFKSAASTGFAIRAQSPGRDGIKQTDSFCHRLRFYCRALYTLDMSTLRQHTPFPPITGGILAGGQGRRLGGVDKGLVPWRGQPLVQWVLTALKSQTVAQCVSANRHLSTYESLGVLVVSDQSGTGPLAGLAALLSITKTPWLLCVPCDAPEIPSDLAQRLLISAQSANAPAAFLQDEGQRHPTFCIVRCSLADSARSGAEAGQGLADWLLSCGGVPSQAPAPLNLNTPEDFARLETPNAH